MTTYAIGYGCLHLGGEPRAVTRDSTGQHYIAGAAATEDDALRAIARLDYPIGALVEWRGFRYIVASDPSMSVGPDGPSVCVSMVQADGRGRGFTVAATTSLAAIRDHSDEATAVGGPPLIAREVR